MNPRCLREVGDEDPRFWELKRSGIALATLEESSEDFPWVYCQIHPKPAFESFRHLFARVDGAWSGQERKLHEMIANEDIQLFARDGQRIATYTLVINGSDARLTFTEV